LRLIKETIRPSDFSRNDGGKSKVDRVKKQILEEEELDAALAVSDNFEELVIRLLYETGCRAGEIAALKRSDISYNKNSMERNPVEVSITKTYVQGKGVQDEPKFEDSNRIVALREETGEKLKSYMDKHNVQDEEMIFKDLSDPYGVIYDTFKDVFTFAEVRIGENGLTNATPHFLRHTRATEMMREGISKEQIQKYLGHSSVVNTEVYTHFAPDTVPKIF
jgi:integrase